MTEDEFWSVVERSRERARGRVEYQPGALEDLLRAMPPDDVLAFRRHLLDANDRAYTTGLAVAASLLAGGVSDDRFTDFRTWLICHGRAAFERVVREPDDLADLPFRNVDEELGHAEEFGYVPDEVYEELTGEEPPDEPAGASLDDTPTGDPIDVDDLDALRSRFPRLSSRART